MKIFRREDPDLESSLKRLENQLMEALQPVPPRRQFVNSLYIKMVAKDFPTATPGFSQKVSNGVLITGGIVGSVIMLVTGIRGLISLISFVGLVFQHLSRGSRRQQTTPV